MKTEDFPNLESCQETLKSSLTRCGRCDFLNLMNHFFNPHRLTFLMDAQCGSSGKGKMCSYIVKNADNCQLLITSNSPNASHRVVDGDKDIIFKSLPSGALYHERIEKVYITAGAIIDVASLLSEIEQVGIPCHKVMIHPRCGIVTQIDVDYEKGLCDLDGVYAGKHEGTISTGSTCSGSGAVLAKKVLRHKTLKVAADVPELQHMLGVCEADIMEKLNRGRAGLFEIGQGFPLSVNHWLFAPHTTSRQVTVSGGLSDAFLPPAVAGQVILNARVNPIRINSKKYLDVKTGKHLTWGEVQSGEFQVEQIDSPSGDWYPDQTEVDWNTVQETAGIQIPQEVMNTTLTKLPRRVATFSSLNLAEAANYNRTLYTTHLSLNFVNFLDGKLDGARDAAALIASDLYKTWYQQYVRHIFPSPSIVGTGMQTDDTIDVWGSHL